MGIILNEMAQCCRAGFLPVNLPLHQVENLLMFGGSKTFGTKQIADLLEFAVVVIRQSGACSISILAGGCQ